MIGEPSEGDAGPCFFEIDNSGPVKRKPQLGRDRKKKAERNGQLHTVTLTKLTSNCWQFLTHHRTSIKNNFYPNMFTKDEMYSCYIDVFLQCHALMQH